MSLSKNSIPLISKILIATALLLPSILFLSGDAYSSWTPDGVIVAPHQPGTPINMKSISDGSGGSIAAWIDPDRNGIYLQKVDASGNQLWPADGLRLSGVNISSGLVSLVSDGSGGAIIGWEETRAPQVDRDIYVQCVDAAGQIQWTSEGVAVCTATGPQGTLQLVSDGAGGAIMAWLDYRDGISWEIYTQRVNSSGAPQWLADGIQVCEFVVAGSVIELGMAEDGIGGAFIVWIDFRGFGLNLVGMHVENDGTLNWNANGEALSSIFSNKFQLDVAPDGTGGLLLSWHDDRNPVMALYAHRVDIDANDLWASYEVLVADSIYSGTEQKIISSGDGGAILMWGGNPDLLHARRITPSGALDWSSDMELTSSSTTREIGISQDENGGAIMSWIELGTIQSQRVDSSGTVLWGPEEVSGGTPSPGYYESPQIMTDDTGGAYILWTLQGSSSSSRTNGVYIQHMNPSGFAQWRDEGLGLSTLHSNQINCDITGDGAGGAIIVWQDERSAYYDDLWGLTVNYDIYAQRVDAEGVPLWGVTGVEIRKRIGDQTSVRVQSDGAGGCIIGWSDDELDSLFVQRLDASGSVLWADGGIAILESYSSNSPLDIITDGTGGMIAVAVYSEELKAQRVNGSGVVEWTSGGITVSPTVTSTSSPHMIADGSGGVIVTWSDARITQTDIYAQRLNSSGIALWTANGIAVSTAAEYQAYPLITSDGAGGALITWVDGRNARPMEYDVYAQLIDASGLPQWTIDGVCVNEQTEDNWPGSIAADGAGGAYISYDKGTNDDSLLVQRIGPAGTVEWADGGVKLSFGPIGLSAQSRKGIISDGAGGAIATWCDERNGDFDVYTQRIGPDGAIAWTEEGLEVCAEDGHQRRACIVSDGGVGAIITWFDGRDDYTKIYAQETAGQACEVEPSAIDFGTLPASGWADTSFVLRNLGDMTIDGDVTESCESYSIISGGGPYSLAPGDSIIVSIIFSPESGDSLECSIETGGLYGCEVSCIGAGVGPLCDVTPADIVIEDPVDIGGYADTSFTITNQGGGSISGSITGGNSHFTIISGGGPFLLYSDDSHTVDVRYEPVQAGNHTCVIQTGQYTCGNVTLSGIGYTCPADTVYYVDADATGASDGSSWSDAFIDLQDALAVAWCCPSVTQVWVAEGTYTPTSGSDRTETFQIYRSMALYGGFSGTESSLSERDIVSNNTVLSGEIGLPGISDNSYHVVYAWGVDSTAVLDGFTVTGGNADSTAWNGGGLLSSSGSPVISNVVFSGNRAIEYGGGAYAWTGSVKFFNVVFEGNTAEYGGGLCIGGKGNSRLVNTVFTGNTATVSGGAIYNVGTDPLLLNSTISGNTAGSGGGITCDHIMTASNPVIVNTIFYSNSALTYPEVENVGSSTPVISYSLIEGCGGSGSWNSAYGTDGGNNLDADPLFVDPVAGNLRLIGASPAINTGDNGAAYLSSTDIDGNARIELGTVDMGAYEFTCPGDAILYVDADATGSGDGSSWTDACNELYVALDLVDICTGVTEIWVAEGTYLPTGDADRETPVQLRDGLALYGGFAGNETTLDEREIMANLTVLSGDIGAQGDASDNSYHVVSGSGTDSTAVIDGFTITGGNADGVGDTNDGAGMIVEGGSPGISNCVFTGNTALSRGAGLHILEYSHPKVINCLFIGNSVTDEVNWGGGGLACNNYSDPLILNCSFYDNSAYRGGGIYHGNQCDATIMNVVMWGDSAADGDYEIYNSNTDATISYSLVEGSGGSGAGWAPGLGIDGGDNIDADPLYVDAESGNLRLGVGSPAIDAGNGAHAELPNEDITGDSRIKGATVDMGCFEGGSGAIDVTVTTIPSGLEVSVDDTTHVAPWAFGGEGGDEREIGTTSPQLRGDSLYYFTGWSDGEDTVHTVTLPDTNITYTASFMWSFTYAEIDSIVDVPGDQGGWVRIYFRRAYYDNVSEVQYPIERYDLHRRVDLPLLADAVIADGQSVTEDTEVTLQTGDRVVLKDGYLEYENRYYIVPDVVPAAPPPGVWEVVGIVSAQQESQYIGLAPTLSDSSETVSHTAFYISAHTTTPAVFFDSPPDSGYSIDNIPPGVPLGLSVAYNTGSGNQLTWDDSPEPDFQYYRIYRGDSETFTPGPGNLAAQAAVSGWTDPEYDGWDVHYKVTALDHVENESDAASPATTTGDELLGVPKAFALYQNVPNPFNPATRISFDLPRAGYVKLSIYNIKGELIATIIDRHMTEGRKETIWTGSDNRGRTVSSGIYFYRIVAGDFAQTKKMVLLR